MREKESKKRYTVCWCDLLIGNQSKQFPSMGLAVAYVRRLLRLGCRKAEDLSIDVEHLAGTGHAYGWYPWASYRVMADGKYERVC